MVAVFPAIFPASIVVAPYSPIALAKVRIVPDAIPGPAVGMITLRKILNSDIPNVLPACSKLISICSKAALAFLYIKGKAMTVAAIMHPSQVWTTCISKVSLRKIPNVDKLFEIRGIGLKTISGFIAEIEEDFPRFFAEEVPANPLKSEMFLPKTIGQLLEAKKATVKVLRTSDKWYGVTYAADKPQVVAALKDLAQQGAYPDGLWK